MHKAGGIIALIAGILAIPALIFTAFFTIGDAVVNSNTDTAYDAGYSAGTALAGYLIGGVFSIAVVVVLSIIILNTRTRWPGIVMAIVALLAIIFNWAGGFVSVCLAFALLGALMSLNLGQQQTAQYSLQR